VKPTNRPVRGSSHGRHLPRPTGTRKGGIKACQKLRGYDRLDEATQRPSLQPSPAPAGQGRRRRAGIAGDGCGAAVLSGRSCARCCRGLGQRILDAVSPRWWLVRLRSSDAMLRLASYRLRRLRLRLHALLHRR
jgi:hypothetical protein